MNYKATPPVGLTAEANHYLNNLQVGDEVIEAGQSCMTGARGVVYRSVSPPYGLCVMWEYPDGKMGTSVTHGTRRLTDVEIIQA